MSNGHGSVVVDSLFIVAAIFCGGSLVGLSSVMCTWWPLYFFNRLEEEKRAVCFVLSVFPSCDC